MNSPWTGRQWQWRSLTPADLPSLTQCVELVYSHSPNPVGGAWSEEQLGLEVQHHCSRAGFFEPFGLTCFVLWQELPDACEIRLLGTHPQWQRRGLMLHLLRSVIKQIPRGKELWLEVHAGNRSARNLYEQLGFLEAGRRPRYYRDGAEAILFSYRPIFPPEKD